MTCCQRVAWRLPKDGDVAWQRIAGFLSLVFTCALFGGVARLPAGAWHIRVTWPLVDCTEWTSVVITVAPPKAGIATVQSMVTPILGGSPLSCNAPRRISDAEICGAKLIVITNVKNNTQEIMRTEPRVIFVKRIHLFVISVELEDQRLGNANHAFVRVTGSHKCRVYIRLE